MRTFAILAAAIVAMGNTGEGAAEEPPRPNVVIVVSDDHGFGDIGWNNPQVKTPQLDQFARDGVRLDRFYANPICSVTRAALMTGIATIKTGVSNSSGLDLKFRILPQAFHDAGYQTWMCGKWHLGGPDDCQRSGPDFFPQARGFDYFYGHLHGAIDYYRHERKDLGQLDWQRNGQPVIEGGFSTDLLADDAIRLIAGRDKSRPFLLYLAFNAVHGPLQMPPSADNPGQRAGKRETLLANLTHLDAAIGRLLKAIDDQQLRDNTIALFFGDNGGQLSQGANNGPLSEEKGTTFEGGIRVPAAIRWPGKLAAGGASQQFVAVMDVLPTLCAAAGIESGIVAPIDGVNLWPALAAGKRQPHPPFLIGNKDVACIAEPWKLVSPGRSERPLLFDIVRDPGEKTDLANEHPDKVAAMSKQIADAGSGGAGKIRRAEKKPLRKSNTGGQE